MYSCTKAYQEYQLPAPIHLVRQLRLGLLRRVCVWNLPLLVTAYLLPLHDSGIKAKRSWFSAVETFGFLLVISHPWLIFLDATVPEIIANVRASPKWFVKECGPALQLMRYCRLGVAKTVTKSSSLPRPDQRTVPCNTVLKPIGP